MAGARTDGQSNALKNRADTLRGLATSGVLVQARTVGRDLTRAGVGPLTPVAAERMGQLTPSVTPRVQTTEQPSSAERAQAVTKPGTQVELPAAGFGQAGVAKGQEVTSPSAGTESNQTRTANPSFTEAVATRSDTLQQVAQRFREQKVEQKDVGAGPTGATPTTRTAQDRGADRTR